MGDDEEEEPPTGIGTYTGDRNEAGERHGYGVAEMNNGDVYEGNYANGKRNGTGTYYFGGKDSPKATYTGNYVDHKKCGVGKMTYPDGTTYEGEWQDDKRHGFGVYTYKSGDTYQGEWKDGKKSGSGSYYSKGTTSEVAGKWLEGKIGSADWKFADGSRFSGSFGTFGKPEGLGMFVMASGNAVMGSYTATTRVDPEDEENLETKDGEWVPGTVVPAYAADLISPMTLAVSDPKQPDTMYDMGSVVAKPVLEQTYAMIKPNAVAAGATEAILDAINEAGFKVVMIEEGTTLSTAEAETFYAEHKGKPFFPALLEFMTSGPIVKLVLEKEGAIKAWRALLGPTNSNKAKEQAPNSLRALYGIDGTQNAAHGSDATTSASREIDLMFPEQSTLLMFKPSVAAGAESSVMQMLAGKGLEVVEKEVTPVTDFPDAPSGDVVKLVVSKRGGVKALLSLLPGLAEFVDYVYASPSVAEAAADIDKVFPVQQTFAIIKPDAMKAGHADAIKQVIADNGFTVLKEEECTLSAADAAILYSEHKEADFYGALMALMVTEEPEPLEEGAEPPEEEPVVNTMCKMVLQKRGAITAWRTLLGPTVPEEARETAPTSIRALYGSEEDAAANAAHGSKSVAAAIREIDLMFALPLSDEEASMPAQVTYAMVKPHAVAAGATDEILKIISNHNFVVDKKEEATLTMEDVQTFYAEHAEKDFFAALAEAMTSGPVLKLQLSRPNAIKAWRGLIGPTNIQKAKLEAPASIRARFGVIGPDGSSTLNACHGADSVESAERELALMFPPPPEPEPEGEAEAEPEGEAEA